MEEKQSVITSSDIDQKYQITKEQLLKLPRDSLQQSSYQWYSLGHIYNDLGGSLYFNYLFFFLKRVVNTPAASIVFLAGQFTDGIVTPLLGHFCDRYGSVKYGQRTPWYFGGNIIFFLGYVLIYMNIHFLFGQTSVGLQYFYYIFANILTNLGWAAVQIANMSLIPTITYCRSHRRKLNNIRNNRTFMCSLLVLIVGSVLFLTVNNATIVIGSMAAGFGVVGIGCSLAYLYKLNEIQLSHGAIESRLAIKKGIEQLKGRVRKYSDGIEMDLKSMKKESQLQVLKFWLKQCQFYLYALFYLSSRIYINVSGTLLPFFIVDVLQFGSDNQVMPVWITINSLIITIFQIITSLLLPKFHNFFAPLQFFSIISIFSFILGMLMLFLNPSVKYLLFLFSVFIGFNQSILLNLSVDLMNEMIGDRVKNGGLLIGFYGLLDKCSSGLVVFILTSLSAFESSLVFKKIAICVGPVLCLGISGIIALVKTYTKKPVIKEQKYIYLQEDEDSKGQSLFKKEQDPEISALQRDMIL